MTGPLPRFIVIGAMKAGTTSLHHYLDAHPDLFLPATKELNFFRDERSFARGQAWYQQQFAGAGPQQVPGEVSPDYTKHPHHTGAAERMHATCPDVRLVYVVREPIERMTSMYLHQVLAGRESRPVDTALLEDDHYLQVSRYGMQADRYLRLFHRDRLLVVATEELGTLRGPVLSRIHRFVGVEPMPRSGEEVEGEWYRGESRRRRGLLARAAAASGPVRRAFTRLPRPLQERARRLGTRPVAPGVRSLSPGAEATLRERLAPDLRRFAEVAPDVVRLWESTA